MNKLYHFWQELKRRNVVRRNTVYAATAFVILEVTSIVQEPLNLPDWTLTLVIVLLCIGFLISVIISWIYEIDSEGAIVKTEPAYNAKAEDISANSKGWKIASYISFVAIISLIILNIIPRIGRSDDRVILDKSIAVLPFIDDSPDNNNEHIINGIMEDLLINLQSIKELRIPGRTSVEQYRNNPKHITEISSELNVAYILAGSGQRYGDKIRLRVQLIEGATDKPLWAKSYDEVINEPEDIFRIQSQIAKLIAAELKAVITPEEKELIEKVPTSSLAAYDLYQRGREEYLKFQLDNSNRKALDNAEDLFLRALDYDSTFAQVYTGLALTDYSKHYSNVLYAGFLSDTYFEDEFMDSILILADIALSYNSQLAEAYVIRGSYYHAKGLAAEAIKEFDKALKFNPNDWMAFTGLAYLYQFDDLLKTIDNFQKAVSLNHGPELPALLAEIGWAYHCAGFTDKNYQYILEALKQSDDSTAYYYSLASSERWLANYEKAIEYGEKVYEIDSTNTSNLLVLGSNYMHLGKDEESLVYLKKWYERIETLGSLSINNMHRIGYAYWQNGFKEEAKYYFDQQINYSNRSNELGRMYSRLFWTYYDLAGVYAFRGEKERALENLRVYNQLQRMSIWQVNIIKDDPLFDNIRNEPEFQQIVRDVETKHNKEHERVRKWLEEIDMM